MHVAVVFATVEGHARMLGEHVTRRLRSAVELAEAAASEGDAMAAAEAAILLGPVHDGHYPAPSPILPERSRYRASAAAQDRGTPPPVLDMHKANLN